MQPVYINHIASIHADTASGESPYLSANEPDYKSIITNAALRRRMSRIIKMGVACGLECISTLPSEKVHAIITATGLGCLADTEKFLNTTTTEPNTLYPVNLQYHRSPNSITPPDTCLQHDVCAPGIEFRKCTIGRYDENLGR